MSNMNVRSNQASYPTQGQPNRPVSPFDQTGASRQPTSPFQQDSVASQPVARGIQPNINLLHDQQSSVSPFHRPDGETRDFLEQPIPSTPGGNTPAAPAEPAPIIFVFPKDIPEGPAQANIQQTVLQEIQPIQQPQQALQVIAAHAENARGQRETANRFTWGARYYAVQAAEIAEQTQAQWDKMDPGQRQVFMSKVQEYRDLAIANLNEAKKNSIGTYNSALKANLVYNHFFTTAGPMKDVLDDSTRGVVKAELDDAWSRWNGSFEKEWQGQMVQAKGIMTIIDETSAEVANHLHRMNSVLSQLN